MAISDIYSKRKKKLQNAEVDPFQYTKLPEAFRVQVVHIWNSAVGNYHAHNANTTRLFWGKIHSTLCRELGRFTLAPGHEHGDFYQNSVDFLLKAETDQALDIIDLSFRLIDRAIKQMDEPQRKMNEITQLADDAIEELNHRFKEHRIGYQFEGDELIRIDSQFMHEETVKPTIYLLRNEGFEGAEEEFLKAHEHFRHGRRKEAIAEALKSFESTMKIICTRKKWTFKSTDTASKLIDVIISNNLIPSYLQSHVTSLRSTLESGVPVVRNKTSGHGQGEQSIEVPDHYASYVLHLTASNIVFLVQCYLNIK